MEMSRLRQGEGNKCGAGVADESTKCLVNIMVKFRAAATTFVALDGIQGLVNRFEVWRQEIVDSFVRLRQLHPMYFPCVD